MEQKRTSFRGKPAQTAFEVELNRLRKATSDVLARSKKLGAQLEGKEELFKGAVSRLKNRSRGTT